MNEPIVPLISSSVVGPSGIVNLPRVWQKVLLHARGRLMEGYRHGHGGLDEATFVNLGIDADAFIAFVGAELPDYLTCEKWVLENGTKIDPVSIAAHNRKILTWNQREELAGERRVRFGIADPTFANAVHLNDLDDWATFHAQLLKSGPETP